MDRPLTHGGGRRAALLLAVAVFLHNLEEWVALGLMPEVLGRVEALSGLAMPDLATIRAGLVVFAAFPLVILWRFAAYPTPRLTFVTCMIGAMTAANALMPHLALALATGGYVPGLLSAVLLTLPVGTATLWRARRDRWLPPRRWLAAIVLGVLLIPAVLLGFWAGAELLAALSG